MRVRDQRGASLIVVLALVAFLSALLPAALGLVLTGSKVTVPVVQDRREIYAATSAIDAAIELGTYDDTIGMPDPFPGDDEPGGPCPDQRLTINDFDFEVSCNPLPASADASCYFDRYVTYEAKALNPDFNEGAPEDATANPKYLAGIHAYADVVYRAETGAVQVRRWTSESPASVTPPDAPDSCNAPTAVAAADPTSGTAPLTVSFTGSGSSDADGTIASYAWDFGDGAGSTEADPTHLYTTPGTFTAELTVTDDSGDTGVATVSITVNTPSSPVFTDWEDQRCELLPGNKWRAQGTVVVTDQTDIGIEGVEVTVVVERRPPGGDWTAVGPLEVFATIDTGKVTYYSPAFNTTGANGAEAIRLRITGVSDGGWTEDPALEFIEVPLTGCTP